MHRAGEPDQSSAHEAYAQAVLRDLRDLLTVVDRRLQGALNQPKLHAHLLALRTHISKLIQNAVEAQAS